MGHLGWRVGGVVWGALITAGLTLAVIPQSWLPDRPTLGAATTGEFAGNPVRWTAPEGDTRAMIVSVEVWMRAGTCSARLRDAEGSHLWGNGREVSWDAVVSSGDEVLLEPHGNAGRYDISIRLPLSEWRLLGPKLRRFILLPGVLGVLLMLIFRRQVQRLQERLHNRGVGPGRQLFVAALIVLSGLVLYPVVHEAGHVLAGVLFGGTVDLDRVVWTPLTGEEPHVAFAALPESAGPWMTAGGTVLPPVVALLLLAIRRLLPGSRPWSVSTALLVVATLFLFSTLGCLFELYRDTHLDALAVHFGLTGPVRLLFSLSPLIMATTVLVLVLRTSRRG